MSTPTVLLTTAPARTGRQITALYAAVSLLERLRSIAVLVLTVEADFSPNLPVRLDAQISTQDADPGPTDAARLDRLNAASVALDASIVHTWTGESQAAFALDDLVIDGVPVRLWAAFTDPAVIAHAHDLTTLRRR